LGIIPSVPFFSDPTKLTEEQQLAKEAWEEAMKLIAEAMKNLQGGGGMVLTPVFDPKFFQVPNAPMCSDCDKE
jgi:hypothetical protein